MKKYLALALLTCAGVSFLHAGEASANPTPAEAFRLSAVHSKKAGRKQIKQADKTEFVAVDMPEDLSRTQVISKEALQKLLEADLIDQEEAELKCRKDAKIKELEASFREIKEKRDVTSGTVDTKNQKLQEYTEERATLGQQAEQKEHMPPN